MKILKKAIDFYIDSSLHVAFAVYCLLEITIFSNQLIAIEFFSFCVFFGTILGYNFLKYFEVFKKNKFHSNKYYAILTVSFLAGLGFLYTFYFLNNSIQNLILMSGFFVLIYPFLRKKGWLKLFLVSFVVTFITVYIPFKGSNGLTFELYLSFFQRFFILISLLIPFEIMDSKTDDRAMNTLPQVFGINKAKQFGILMIIPFVVLEFSKLCPSYFIILIGIIITLFVNFTELKRNKYYTSFWVESIPVFWWLMLLLVKKG